MHLCAIHPSIAPVAAQLPYWLNLEEDKAAFALSHAACVADLGPSACDHIPLGFELPADVDRWIAYANGRPADEFWIVKPRTGFSRSFALCRS